MAEQSMLAIRVSAEERRLIEEAAKQKGWKTAKFLRASALERAAQVLNSSRPTSFDFSGVARQVAETLVAARSAEIVHAVGEGERLGRLGEDSSDLIEPAGRSLEALALDGFYPRRLFQHDVEGLQKALRLGGLDFADQLIVECLRALGRTSDPSLPPPIDPHNLSE